MSNDVTKTKCIVKGCPNHKHEGRFVGDMCGPCYKMITTGDLNCGETFIHKMRDAYNDSTKGVEILLADLFDVLDGHVYVYESNSCKGHIPAKILCHNEDVEEKVVDILSKLKRTFCDDEFYRFSCTIVGRQATTILRGA